MDIFPGKGIAIRRNVYLVSDQYIEMKREIIKLDKV